MTSGPDGVVAVVTRGNRLLVVRRSQFVVAPGTFCFQGGGVHEGETELVAAVRELDPRPAIWGSFHQWGDPRAWETV